MGIKEHEYVRQTLERYTNCPLEDFCGHILITDFRQYIHLGGNRRASGERVVGFFP
jgi:AMP nucleosidase